MNTIKVFIASSNELEQERRQFESAIARKNKRWNDHDVRIELDIWEDLSAKMSLTHSQEEYNKYVQKADIVVVLAWNKVGKYTLSEFETAERTFKNNAKPFIFVYFKSNPPEEQSSLSEFKTRLNNAGYFYPSFDSFEHLWVQFNRELDDVFISEFGNKTAKSNKDSSSIEAGDFEAQGKIDIQAEQKSSSAKFKNLKSGGDITININQG